MRICKALLAVFFLLISGAVNAEESVSSSFIRAAMEKSRDVIKNDERYALYYQAHGTSQYCHFFGYLVNFQINSKSLLPNHLADSFCSTQTCNTAQRKFVRDLFTEKYFDRVWGFVHGLFMVNGDDKNKKKDLFCKKVEPMTRKITMYISKKWWELPSNN